MQQLMPMQLRNRHRDIILAGFLNEIKEPKEVSFRERENDIAIRMLRHRYGDDILERCHKLGPEWLRPVKNLPVDRLLWDMGKNWLELIEYTPLPCSASNPWTREEIGPLFDDIDKLVTDRHQFSEEFSQIREQIRSALRSYSSAKKLANEWPEAYAHFPKEESSSNLPAIRISDLNVRIAAMKGA